MAMGSMLSAGNPYIGGHHSELPTMLHSPHNNAHHHVTTICLLVVSGTSNSWQVASRRKHSAAGICVAVELPRLAVLTLLSNKMFNQQRGIS